MPCHLKIQVYILYILQEIQLQFVDMLYYPKKDLSLKMPSLPAQNPHQKPSLVGGIPTYPSEKYESVGSIIPNCVEKCKIHVPNHHPHHSHHSHHSSETLHTTLGRGRQQGPFSTDHRGRDQTGSMARALPVAAVSPALGHWCYRVLRGLCGLRNLQGRARSS